MAVQGEKFEHDIRYALTQRTDPDVDEPAFYWLGSDGSTIELTDEEAREYDVSAVPLEFDDDEFGDDAS